MTGFVHRDLSNSLSTVELINYRNDPLKSPADILKSLKQAVSDGNQLRIQDCVIQLRNFPKNDLPEAIERYCELHDKLEVETTLVPYITSLDNAMHALLRSTNDCESHLAAFFATCKYKDPPMHRLVALFLDKNDRDGTFVLLRLINTHKMKCAPGRVTQRFLRLLTGLSEERDVVAKMTTLVDVLILFQQRKAEENPLYTLVRNYLKELPPDRECEVDALREFGKRISATLV